MRIFTVIVAAALLAACSKSDDPNMAKANSDIKAAGAATRDAAGNVAAATDAAAQTAADQAKGAAAKAEDQAGSALQTAGAKVKQDAAATAHDTHADAGAAKDSSAN
jgi:hypothetical protein